MKIEILGMGCMKCNTLHNNVKKAVAGLEINPEIVHIQDMDEILERGVMLTPALSVEGRVVCSGRVPSVDEIIKWIGSEGNGEKE